MLPHDNAIGAPTIAPSLPLVVSTALLALAVSTVPAPRLPYTLLEGGRDD